MDVGWIVFARWYGVDVIDVFGIVLISFGEFSKN